MGKILYTSDVATLCQVKLGKAYQIIRILNTELEKKIHNDKGKNPKKLSTPTTRN